MQISSIASWVRLAALPASSAGQTCMVPPGMVGADLFGLYPVALGDKYSLMAYERPAFFSPLPGAALAFSE